MTINLPGDVPLELVKIPAGSFQMGSDNGDACEKPVHTVNINYGFYVGKYEVTQAQWQAVMGNNPSEFTGNNHPVEQVSWLDAHDFITKLNDLQVGKFRLPSESEWEYTCRAGTTSDYYFVGTDYENYAWFNDNGADITHTVGQKIPNNFGLYDILGNVWEWCEDGWHDDYTGAPNDGSPWVTTEISKTIRGASWINNFYQLRSANRQKMGQTKKASNIGLRLVMEINKNLWMVY